MRCGVIATVAVAAVCEEPRKALLITAQLKVCLRHKYIVSTCCNRDA
jgi:hypothetical protein